MWNTYWPKWHYKNISLSTLIFLNQTSFHQHSTFNYRMRVIHQATTRPQYQRTRSQSLNNVCNISNNQEINDILKGRNIIGFIKKQRFNWLGHIEHMAEDNNVQKIKRWKPMSKRPIGRPKTCWENDVLEDIRNMNVHNWKKMTQNKPLSKPEPYIDCSAL